MNEHSRPSGAKSVVVTGGASGLGLAMTAHFASQGHRVTILDVNAESGPGVAAEVASQHPQATVTFKKSDVSSWNDLAAVFKEIYQEAGRIDIVMANAGISGQGTSNLAVEDGDEPSEPKLKTLDVNLTGTIYSVKLAIHYMQKNQPDPSTGSKGSIICTASNAGLYAFPVAPLYAASKFGVIGLVRSLGPVLGRQGIQINALAPAVLESNIAPSKELFKNMIITPKSTLIRGVAKFIEDPGLCGCVAEIHGEDVTLRPPHDFVDVHSRTNLETFWGLGYA
ncbi:Uu.00g140090.m01.CDS01 [Anthostomella pinea]|uniref:Uu.00g140090.m01.CDS01 n=1 Tax=Anthostomella pinea TaxID=933095 RepID=A0AAI8VQY1_9PEZI|nr:Uu.00g140090.m01.CDS01 [Anthostomella pinea]